MPRQSKSSTKTALLNALTALNAKGDNWVTRSYIATHLKAPSGILSPNRRHPLDELVDKDNKVERRIRTTDARQVYEYRLK